MILVGFLHLAVSQYLFDRVFPELFTDIDYQPQIYAGYLQAGFGVQFYYQFYYSKGKPFNDPIIVHFNGGPGCSSLLGAFKGHGPFYFQPNKTQLKLNPNSWNKRANLLFIQSPAGVGFSKQDNSTQQSDQKVASDNLNALYAFYLKYPKFRPNQIYLSGQGYAGVTVPYLAVEIHNYNRKEQTAQQQRFNLVGVILSNPCTTPDQCFAVGQTGLSYHTIQYLYNRFYFSQQQFNQFRTACIFGYLSQKCQSVVYHMAGQFNSTKTSLQNIYEKCYQHDINQQHPVCQDYLGVFTFMNSYFTRKAFHASTNGQWNPCSTKIKFSYKKSPYSSYFIHYTLLQNRYRVLVMSGDASAQVPITGTLKWVNRLKQELKLPFNDPWRVWKLNQTTGGMTVTLSHLTVVSIRSQGQQGSSQPQLTSAVIDRFLNQTKI